MLKSLKDSPCYQCGCPERCDEKIERNLKFQEIQDWVFGKAGYDYHECPLWIALNAPEMIEVDDEYRMD